VHHNFNKNNQPCDIQKSHKETFVAMIFLVVNFGHLVKVFRAQQHGPKDFWKFLG
jgi:hypothetical protein